MSIAERLNSFHPPSYCGASRFRVAIRKGAYNSIGLLYADTRGRGRGGMFDPNYVLGDRGKSRGVGRASANQYISMSYKYECYLISMLDGIALHIM